MRCLTACLFVILSFVWVQAQDKKIKEEFAVQITSIIHLGEGGKFDQAVKHARQCIVWAIKMQYDSAQSAFNLFAGIGYRELAQPDSAVIFLTRADSIARQKGYLRIQVRAKLAMVDVYQLLSVNPKRSNELLLELNPIIKQLDEHNLWASLEAKLAYQEEQSQHYNNALQHYLNGLNHHRAISDEVNESITLLNIGVLLHNLKRHQQSILYYRKSIVLSKKNNKEHRLAIIYFNMGQTFLELKMKDSAKLYFTKAISVAKKNNNTDVLTSAYLGLATILQNDSIHTNDKLKNESETTLERSLLVSQKRGLVQATIETEISLAKFASNKKNYALSKQYLTHALQEANRIHENKSLILIHAHLGQLYVDLGDYKKGYDFLSKAFYYKDTLYQQNILKSTDEIEAKYQNAMKEKEIQKLTIAKTLLALKHQNERQQYWLISGMIIFVILLSGILLYYRNKQRLQKKDKELQDMVMRVNETKQVALRAQMNPHFIFNCMATVDDFILKNERKKASELLTSFAHLVRQVLENSEHNMISLQEEMATLKVYLDIEQLRFNNSFEYTIEMAEDIELMVPPLLLQPYVENAIIHGISNTRRGDEKIEIKVVSEHENKLTIIIRDNGQGRNKSVIQNPQTSEKHSSMGTRITEERINLLRSVNGMNGTVSIIDLYDAQHDATGTEVRITLEEESVYP